MPKPSMTVSNIILMFDVRSSAFGGASVVRGAVMQAQSFKSGSGIIFLFKIRI